RTPPARPQPHRINLLDREPDSNRHLHCPCPRPRLLALFRHRLLTAMDAVFQRCINPACAATLPVDDTRFVCARCGSLLDVAYDWDRLRPPRSLREFEAKWADRANPLSFSGVWRFRELLPFAPPDKVLTIGEGQTILQQADAVAGYV